MYTIKGIDGREYGPVDMDTLRSWTGAGRIRWDTEIHDKVSDRRTRAGDMNELRPLLQSVPPLPDEIEARRTAGPPPEAEVRQTLSPSPQVKGHQGSPPTGSPLSTKPKWDI